MIRSAAVSDESWPWRLLCVTILLAVACWTHSAAAADVTGAAPVDPALAAQIRAANAECYACHSAEGRAHPPRADLDLDKLRGLSPEPAAFDASNHAGMRCTVCHGAGYARFPHAPEARAAISPCGECHAQKAFRVETQFDASVHAKRLKEQFACWSCHNPHAFRVAQKLVDPRKILAQDNAMCVACHESDARYDAVTAGLTPKTPRPDLAAAHRWLPNPTLHWGAVRCIDCHTPPSPVKSLGVSHEILPKAQAEKRCVACHSQDTALLARLYRYAATTPDADLGFTNAALLGGGAYVIGATRHPALDQAVLALFALTFAALIGHGGLRLVCALIRRRRRS